MDIDGTYVEMLAVSHLLNGPVFCFLERIQRWQRLAPNNVDRILPESEPGEMEIYMHHPRGHVCLTALQYCLALKFSLSASVLHLKILFLFQPQYTPKIAYSTMNNYIPSRNK